MGFGLSVLGAILALFLSTSAFAVSTTSDCESVLLSNKQVELRFPTQLRLKAEKVKTLLASDDHSDLVQELGALFYKLEARPEILDRLPLLLNGPANPPKLHEGLPPALRELVHTMTEVEMRNFGRRFLQLLGGYEESLLSQHQIAWLAFLTSSLPVEKRLAAEFNPNFEKTGAEKLNYLMRTLRTRPQHRQLFEAMIKQGGFRDLLTEDFNEIVLRILSQGHTLPEELYITVYREIIDNVERYERDHSTVDRGLSPNDFIDQQYKNIRGVISILVIAPSIAAHLDYDVAQDELEELVDHHSDHILNFLEDIYFGTNFKNYDHQVYMDMMEFIIFGTPLPYTKDQVFNAILTTANRILLPAKNYGSQVKADGARQRQEENRLRYEIREFILRPLIEAPPRLERQFSPSKKRRDKQPSSDEAQATTSTVESIVKTPSILGFTKYAHSRRPLEKLKAETNYELEFLRDSSSAKHQIVFSEQVLLDMGEETLEAYQCLDGLVAGFTNRTHDGAGLKRIYQRGVSTSNIYEVRPNRGNYRLIIRRENNLWRVESFVKKTDFNLELSRVRGR